MLNRRRAGVLLHITSLPGGTGNGDLGKDAHAFVDFLCQCGLTVWQTLPIGPTHDDGSPYQCMSAHAGNPLLINLEWLVERGWLPKLSGPELGESATDYRNSCLHQAFMAFRHDPDDAHWQAYGEFVKLHASWLGDFALYAALREEFKHQPWHNWPTPLRDRRPAVLEAARLRLSEAIARVKFEQFVFFQQWKELREYARSRGVILFGDMPIFVGCDSADVWACREYFDLAENGLPRVVAGVPPDYFSAIGQRWGNPHYDWKQIAEEGFSWWIERLNGQLELFDWVRIDHFRGFEAYWEIPAHQDTAIHGRWVKAPGKALLEALFQTFPGEGLPLVAENLGIITPEVEELRNNFSIPGMLILQFAFDGGPNNPYLPHNHEPNNVVYTGTHDNDTTLSWFESLSGVQQRHVYEYLGNSAFPMPLVLMQSALSSVAKLAILPMQDILELGQGYRMNTPGTVGGGNWRWRFQWEQIDEEKIERLVRLIRLYGRN
ncbi:MAG: 4-alpha-glucanotransferase [Methylococcaceae bacterium]|nr:4-alpha-glucanotransferase [Methylococcaceae bacterium]